MKKKTLLATLTAAAMLAGLLTGCGSQQPETPAPQESTTQSEGSSEASGEPAVSTQDSDAAKAEAFGYELNLNPGGSLNGQYAGQTLTVFCCTGEFSEPLQESIDAFQKLSGATVNLYIYSFDELNSKIALALAGDEEMDITCFVSAYMDTFNSVGQLANLTELSGQYGSPDYNWNGFSKALLERTSDSDGVFAVPYQVCEMMGFYRKDLIEDPAIQADYKEKTGKELTVPETTDELKEIAAYFRKAKILIPLPHMDFCHRV